MNRLDLVCLELCYYFYYVHTTKLDENNFKTTVVVVVAAYSDWECPNLLRIKKNWTKIWPIILLRNIPLFQYIAILEISNSILDQQKAWCWGRCVVIYIYIPILTPLPNFRVCTLWNVPTKQFKICHVSLFHIPKYYIKTESLALKPVFHFLIFPLWMMPLNNLYRTGTFRQAKILKLIGVNLFSYPNNASKKKINLQNLYNNVQTTNTI